MHAIFTILVFVPAFIAGLGIISFHWMAISLIAAYLDSILTVGESVGGDFRKLDSEEFLQEEKVMNMMRFGSVVLIALTYGLGWLISWIF